MVYLGGWRYGWAPLGTMPSVIQDLKRSTRRSILPAFTIEGYIAYKIHHGSITTEIFNDFVKTKVLPYCAGVNGPRSVLVMDNASSHHNGDVLLTLFPGSKPYQNERIIYPLKINPTIFGHLVSVPHIFCNINWVFWSWSINIFRFPNSDNSLSDFVFLSFCLPYWLVGIVSIWTTRTLTLWTL